jgi:hypothetical protein
MSISLANSPSEATKLPTSAASPRKYQFKQNLRDSQSRKHKDTGKDEYRYNLFSVVDEGCYASCRQGCCADNEIIASKVQERAWN